MFLKKFSSLIIASFSYKCKKAAQHNAVRLLQKSLLAVVFVLILGILLVLVLRILVILVLRILVILVLAVLIIHVHHSYLRISRYIRIVRSIHPAYHRMFCSFRYG